MDFFVKNCIIEYFKFKCSKFEKLLLFRRILFINDFWNICVCFCGVKCFNVYYYYSNDY